MYFFFRIRLIYYIFSESLVLYSLQQNSIFHPTYLNMEITEPTFRNVGSVDNVIVLRKRKRKKNERIINLVI